MPQEDLFENRVSRLVKGQDLRFLQAVAFPQIDQLLNTDGVGIYVQTRYRLETLRPKMGNKSVVIGIRDIGCAVKERDIQAELKNVGLTCGGFAIGGLLSFFSAVALPAHGGVVTYIVGSGTLAAFLSCGDAPTRLTSQTYVDFVDTKEWYVYLILALDAISLLSGAFIISNSLKNLARLRKISSNELFRQIDSMSRGERKAISKEIAEIIHPGVPNRALKEMLRTGALPKRFLFSDITQTSRKELLRILAIGFDFLGSGYIGILNQINKEIVLAIQEDVPK